MVKIKSLPFDASQLDVIQFFDSFRMKANGVQIVVRSDNKPTGEAFVDFESPEEAVRAIRDRDHKVFSEKFGDRYVRLIQVTRREMQATLALRFGGEGILKMKVRSTHMLARWGGAGLGRAEGWGELFVCFWQASPSSVCVSKVSRYPRAPGISAHSDPPLAFPGR